ncbi:helix-turn-helix transcriptional regulator [Paenibacillus sp. MSJ-34]|uniref:helix-turn-helix domain-containing protein n=1 Tax=Paenibacillus sp. MSJ-34 TaxID=2841529 RepID=UPI001C101071|nr:helix-turn-helix transcriptional regulator [Paenibacillus sp. MSJ-34]MBU5445682.1 helix-turn-helix domain-containing protein [Paenibacillus sp. MSJ-34]
MTIKQWRIKRIASNIKLKDVAKAIGISDSYLCKYEKEQVKLDHRLIDKYKRYIEEHSAT